MRRENEKTIREKFAGPVQEDFLRDRDLAARFAALTHRLELAETARRNITRDQKVEGVIHEADDSASPIEVVTENGFSITRPWERAGSPVPTGGTCRFRVSDASGRERDVHVEISRSLIAETVQHTGGRIQASSDFWICCAERHLANYVCAFDAFPEGDNLFVESLDSEEVILAMRWRRSKTD